MAKNDDKKTVVEEKTVSGGGMPYGYEGKGYGGTGPVIQEPVDTGNHHLDKAINKFYNCLSHTHEDPPTIEKTDNCYYQTLGGNTDNLK